MAQIKREFEGSLTALRKGRLLKPQATDQEIDELLTRATNAMLVYEEATHVLQGNLEKQKKLDSADRLGRELNQGMDRMSPLLTEAEVRLQARHNSTAVSSARSQSSEGERRGQRRRGERGQRGQSSNRGNTPMGRQGEPQRGRSNYRRALNFDRDQQNRSWQRPQRGQSMESGVLLRNSDREPREESPLADVIQPPESWGQALGARG